MLTYKSINISRTKYDVLISHTFSSQNKSELSFLFYGLNTRNGTYASLDFISGVEEKNPSIGCKFTAF